MQLFDLLGERLPAEVKEYVWQRFGEILHGRDTSKEFEHLSAEDRQAILEILRETHTEAADALR